MDGTSAEPDPPGSVHGPGTNIEELHPLQNPVILQGIFKYFNTRDLKSIRMTCQLWHQESMNQWGKLAVVGLYQRKCVYNIYGRDNLFLLEEFGSLINYPGNEWINGGRPYTNYWISHEITLPPYHQLGSYDYPEYQKLFWKMCGSHIKYLNLQRARVRMGRMVDSLKWILLKACPNLTELVLWPNSEDDYDEKEKIEVDAGTGLQEHSTKLMSLKFESYSENLTSSEDARSVLTLVPNLKRLTLENYDVPVLLKALKTKMSNGNHIKLHEITLTQFEGPPGAHFELLREYVEVAKPIIRTVTLRIYLDKVRESPFHFHRWLESIGATVEELDITVEKTRGMDGNELNYLTFVDMTGFSFSCLRSLKLDLFGDMGNNKAIQFDFRALKGMPNLWKLHIDVNKHPVDNFRQLAPDDILKKGHWNWEENRYDDEAATDGDDPTKFKLERLEIFCFSGYLSEECFMLLGDWMPNLRSLETIFNTETYQMSFQMWPNLRKVTMNLESKVCFCCTVIADQEFRGDKNIEVTYYKLVYQEKYRMMFHEKFIDTPYEFQD